MSSVIVAGNTSGSVTLSAPDVAGTTVITLPSTSGTMITTASSGQSIPRAALPAGSILQVVSYSPTTNLGTTSSTTFVASSLALSITPTSATSKIYIQANFPCYTSSTNLGYFTIYRGATNIGGSVGGFGGVTTNNQYTTTGLNFLDSPATTLATTYTLYIRTTAGTFGISDNNLASTITLMEIAA